MLVQRKAAHIEAYQLPPLHRRLDHTPPRWIIERLFNGTITAAMGDAGSLLISQTHGTQHVMVNDWIINIDGVLSVYAPSEFNKEFEILPEALCK